MKKILILTGEASGDFAGACLIRELKKKSEDISIYACGGEYIKSEGINLLYDFSDIGVIGILEALKIIPLLWKIFESVKKSIIRIKPDLVVFIDSAALNMRIAKFCRKKGFKTVYYFPPSAWSKNLKKIKYISQIVDYVIPVFKFSADNYQKVANNYSYFGHPFVDFLNYSRTDKEIKEQLGLDPDKRIIGIFPGSRKQEIRNHMNVMLLSAEKLFQRNKDLFFLIPASSDKIKDLIMEVTEKFSYLPLKVIFRRSHDVLKISHMIITSSGSVTLEAACFGTPMVILYILHWFDYLAGKLLIKGVKFIGLPNFLADREIVPELLQQLATSDIIADKSFKILDAPEEVQRIKKELKNTVTTLGEPPVSEKIAQKVLEILNGNKK